MKEIKAIIRPFKLLKVIEALQQIKTLPGVTISEIIGFGKEEPKDSILNENVFYVPRTKLEVVVEDKIADEVVNVIQQAAFTGNPGDGKIFITTVDDVIKIRTNEHGIAAV
ncbi:MAG: P-II family nitrogen regulator [Ignavibacteriaceae bacterium]|jgi:nitrogen regulatory protein P-II 1|nr:P-II family nitrogen regulator [Ignavibacterium sp.]MCC6254086.1 P-II family nitrogen regulator [Ignavibacteriaceae bacterium]HMN25833.1 P-II family nitrogen regulator [Ignavibacteriaceae bacterium]HRN26249.1 P-II family nitrogen regulator [Ignavibacteriaceae bacterium]HRP91914.1 P-II family nitrogen regulator [Ignavibacteriaceae bacterium]